MEFPFLGWTISTIWAVFILMIWISIAFIPARIAASKGRSFFVWFILSLFFWWITLFVAIAMKDNNSPAATATTPEA